MSIRSSESVIRMSVDRVGICRVLGGVCTRVSKRRFTSVREVMGYFRSIVLR